LDDTIQKWFGNNEVIIEEAQEPLENDAVEAE
jgi:hypothetical protein